MDTTATTTRPEGAEHHATDRPDERPGVPMESERRAGDDAARPPLHRQAIGRERHLHRAALDGPTPVFGTSVAPRGLSGRMRKAAYDIPEHYARHWALLMAADRVDVLEDRLGETLAEPMERIGFETGANYARRNPVAVLAGAVVGAWVAKKIIF